MSSNHEIKNKRKDVQKKEVLPRKEAPTDSNISQAKIRCYNCSKYGHLSKDCELPKREKSVCFKCGKKRHKVNECKGEIELNKSTRYTCCASQ